MTASVGASESLLTSPATRLVLSRIAAAGEACDAAAKGRFRAHRAQHGARLPTLEAAELYRDAPLAVAPEVGRLLYALTLAKRPALAVEFGASFGASTIHLAAALHDAGGGRLISTELLAEKGRAAARNLAEVGLADLVELRIGDARQTLRDLAEPVDLLFLDGFGDLSLPVLRLVEPRLAAGALVVTDQSRGDPYWPAYSTYVRGPDNGYASVNVALDAGVEVSTRVRG
jgi:predicted O-methyltransferase YrrM